MTAARKIEMFKPGYDGPRTEGRMTPLEAQNYARHAEPLIKRLHDAMLTLGALSDEGRGGGSTWPEYVHTFADKVGWDADSEPVKLRYRPTAAQLSDFLPTLQLLDGLSPIFMRVLALRAVGEKVGGFSFAVIGERFGRTEAWARRVHAAVVILAARRSGLLAPAPKGWAIVIAGVRFGGWRSFITTARDPSAALYDLRAKSPVELEAAYAFWTAGKAEAAALAKIARQNMLGRVSHGSWHLMSPEDMADLLIEEQTRLERPYDLEPLSLPRATRTARNAARMMGAEVEGGGDE